METKANYVAVGAFVLICMLGLVIASLWLAGAQYSQEYARYKTYFTGSVTGLGTGTTVRYNGIEVGHVSKLQFDPADPKRVIVLMEVDPSLQLHEDSVASIASMGLTGGAYVEIEGGSKTSPILTPKPGEQYPVIPSKPSTLQQLADSAPQLIAKIDRIADRLNDVLNDKNRKAVGDILDNTDKATAVLAARSGDVDATLKNLNESSRALTAGLKQLRTTLADADIAVRSIDKLSNHADAVVSGDTAAQLSELIAQTRAAVNGLKNLSSSLQDKPTSLFFGDRRQGYSPQ